MNGTTGTVHVLSLNNCLILHVTTCYSELYQTLVINTFHSSFSIFSIVVLEIRGPCLSMDS